MSHPIFPPDPDLPIDTQMPLAAGFVGILPALGLLDEQRDGVPVIHLSWLSAIGWSCAVAFFG